MGTGTYFSQKFWPDSVLRQIDDELFAKKAWEGVADIRTEFKLKKPYFIIQVTTCVVLQVKN